MRYDLIHQEEIPSLIERVRRGYIGQKVAQGSWDAADAEAATEEELAALFPGGALLDGHEVYLLRDDADPASAEPLGHLWIGVLRQMSGTLYVFDLEIREDARGRGIGRAAMVFAEHRARALGCRNVALHVFGGNTGAIDLYRSLGYQVIDLTMKKELPD